MTMKQKKGFRTAAHTLLFLLVAIGTFDSRHGHLAAQSGSVDITSAGNIGLRKPEASPPAERLATAQAPLKIEEIKRAKPAPTPWELPPNKSDESYHAKKPDPVQKPNPKPEPKPKPKPEPKPESKPESKPDPKTEGDRNRGHGNDEDGYDEDNPGRGGFSGLGSSSGRGGHGGSGGGGSSNGHGGHGGSGGDGSSGGHGGHGGSGSGGSSGGHGGHGGSGGGGSSGGHGGR